MLLLFLTLAAGGPCPERAPVVLLSDKTYEVTGQCAATEDGVVFAVSVANRQKRGGPPIDRFHLSFTGTVQRIYAPPGWRVEFEPIALQGRTGVKWTAVSEGGGVAPGQRVGGFSVLVLGGEAGFACGRGLSFGFRKGQGGGGVFQGCVS